MAAVALTRERIGSRILAGEHLLVYGEFLLRIPQTWIDAHPGGSLAILHFLGRDAADEIEAYHSQHTLKQIRKYIVGSVKNTVDDPWLPFVPPIMSGWVRRQAKSGLWEWHREAGALRSLENSDVNPSSQIMLVAKDSSLANHDAVESAPSLRTLDPPPTDLLPKVQARHSAAYKALHERITDAGLYQTPYVSGYGPEIVRYCILAAVSAFAYRNHWFMTSALFLGLTWHQLVFSAHDLGHMGVTHNWTIDRILGILIADFIGGLSIGWWVQNHNVHHLVTNHPAHDPDIQHIPFFAISTQLFSSLWSSYYKRIMSFTPLTKFLISVQHKLFYVIMAFGRFNLYNNSYTFLFQKAFDTKRARGGRWAWWFEVVGITFFWWWFGRVLIGCGSWRTALGYLIVSHVVTSPLHVQIVLSHFSMSTADLGPTESFPHRQLRTTSDVICHPSLQFIHGGLHLQVTHHLFPRLPRHNLRQASALVKEFAEREGLVYAEFGFVEGNKDVLGVLKGVADQARVLGMVAEGEVNEMMDKSRETR